MESTDTARCVAADIRRDLKLDRYGYKPGDAVKTVALNEDGRHLVIDTDGLSGEGLLKVDEAAYLEFRKQFALCVVSAKLDAIAARSFRRLAIGRA